MASRLRLVSRSNLPIRLVCVLGRMLRLCQRKTLHRRPGTVEVESRSQAKESSDRDATVWRRGMKLSAEEIAIR